MIGNDIPEWDEGCTPEYLDEAEYLRRRIAELRGVVAAQAGVIAGLEARARDGGLPEWDEGRMPEAPPEYIDPVEAVAEEVVAVLLVPLQQRVADLEAQVAKLQLDAFEADARTRSAEPALKVKLPLKRPAPKVAPPPERPARRPLRRLNFQA